MAIDNRSSISVDTEAAIFTIRKSKFNLIDQVAVGNIIFVDSHSSENYGVIMQNDTELFSSSIDSLSTAVIEENGSF